MTNSKDLGKKRTDANTEMSQALKLSDQDFKVAIIAT